MRLLALMVALGGIAAGASEYVGRPWRHVLAALAIAGGYAAVVSMYRERQERGLDKPPSIV